MDTLFAILKNVQVTGANAEQNAYVVGAPAPLSFLSYADAYAFAAKEIGVEMTTRWVLPIYHKLSENNLHGGVLKRESVSFDSPEAEVLAPPVRDELRIDFTLSLVMAFTVDAFDDTLESQFDRIKAKLPNRIVGGSIFVNPADERQLKITRGLGWTYCLSRELLWDSHVLVHRPDITAQAANIAELLQLTSMKRNSRLSPIAIGYQAISSRKKRRGQRAEEPEHMFVDPLISVGEWKSAYSILSSPQVWIKQTEDNLMTTHSVQEHYA